MVSNNDDSDVDSIDMSSTVWQIHCIVKHELYLFWALAQRAHYSEAIKEVCNVE